jgi:hypothetical protein
MSHPVWRDEVAVGTVETSSRTWRPYVRLQTYYKPRDSEEGWLPGHRIVVPVEHVEHLRNLLLKAAQETNQLPGSTDTPLGPLQTH